MIAQHPFGSNFYKWHVRNETTRHCSHCRAKNGQVKSGGEWDLVGAPPVHPRCGCSLELVYSDDDQVPDTPPDGALPSPNGRGAGGEGPTDPQPDDETPEYPPGTPSGSAPPTPPPPAAPTSGGGNKRR